jgi:hypothetical protein
MGRYASSRLVTAFGWLTVAAIAVCVMALAVASV